MLADFSTRAGRQAGRRGSESAYVNFDRLVGVDSGFTEDCRCGHGARSPHWGHGQGALGIGYNLRALEELEEEGCVPAEWDDVP